ncbi:MAG: cysteine hydrolase family protein [Candidatus Dormibacter sp.]
MEVDGKQVFSTLDELVDPAHTALVVVDMQRDFCSAGFSFAQQGIDISMYPPMVPRLVRLVDGARSAGIPVIYIMMTRLPDSKIESPAQLRFTMRLHFATRGPLKPLQYTMEGSEGQQIIPELSPKPGDVVVRKFRSSGFWGTNLDMLLRSNAIKSIVVTGVTTEGCVESTARDGLFNDYYVIVPEDCVASDDPAQHDASLLLMRHRFDVVPSEEILDRWAPAVTGPPGTADRSTASPAD